MRDDEAGPAGHQPFQRLLDEPFGRRVDAGSRLVQDEQRRVLQQRPRDAHPLLLAHAELHASFTDPRIIPIPQAFDELIAVGGARGGEQFLLARIKPPIKNVLAESAVEEKRFLADDGNLRAQGVQGHSSEVLPI